MKNNNINYAVAPSLKESREEFGFKPEALSKFAYDEDRPNTLDPLRQYFREIGQIPRITPKEEIELAGRIKNGDEVAHKKMVSANLLLVVTIAKKYQGMGLQFLDLINEGNIGLMKAVEKFNPKKGAKLSTHARPYIKHEICKALGDQSRDVRIPINLIDDIAHMNETEIKLQHELERRPTDEEVAERLGVEVKKVKRMRSVSIPPVQLDSPIGDESDSTFTFADVIPDNRTTDPAENSSVYSDSERMQGFLSKLPKCDRKMLSLRFGLDDGSDGLTLNQIGKVFGVSGEMIRQRQADVFRKLKKIMKEKLIREELMIN